MPSIKIILLFASQHFCSVFRLNFLVMGNLIMLLCRFATFRISFCFKSTLLKAIFCSFCNNMLLRQILLSRHFKKKIPFPVFNMPLEEFTIMLYIAEAIFSVLDSHSNYTKVFFSFCMVEKVGPLRKARQILLVKFRDLLKMSVKWKN